MVRIKILITIAILSSNILSDASAYFYDGNQLIPMMREGERAERSENGADYLKASRFMGYVTGVADAMVCIGAKNVHFLELSHHRRAVIGDRSTDAR